MTKKTTDLPVHGLGREINLAARAMRAVLDSRLRLAETNFATWTALLMLHVEGRPIIQRELAERLEVEGPTLVRRLDQLETDGLVTRSPSPSDRRAILVDLTERGRALFRRVRSSVSETEAELLRGLHRQDIETTLRVLRHLIAASRRLARGG